MIGSDRYFFDMKKKIDFRRVFIISAIIALAVIYAILWMQMISDPAQRTGSDFIAFFTAGKLARQYGFQVVYDIERQQAIQEQIVGFRLVPGQVLLYNHLPFLLPVLWLVAGNNYVVSFYAWVTFIILTFVISFFLLAPLIVFQKIDFVSKIALFSGGILFFPIFVSVMNGQDTALLFLGGACLLVGMQIKKNWLAGIGLGLMSVRPQLALFMTLPFVFRDRKVFLWAFLSAIFLAIISVLLIGIQGVQGFLNILFISAGGEWHGMKEQEMFNLIGLLFRAFPTVAPSLLRQVGWIAYIIAIAGSSIFLYFSGPIGEKQLGILILLALFFSPHLHYHDLALVLLAITLLIRVLSAISPSRIPVIVLLPLITSLLLIFGYFMPGLKYSMPYALWVLLAYLLIRKHSVLNFQNNA